MTKKNPLYQQKIRKQMDNIKMPPKTSITQRLWTDLRRSVGETIVIQLGMVKPVYAYPTFPLTAKAVLSKGQNPTINHN